MHFLFSVLNELSFDFTDGPLVLVGPSRGLFAEGQAGVDPRALHSVKGAVRERQGLYDLTYLWTRMIEIDGQSRSRLLQGKDRVTAVRGGQGGGTG